MPAHLKLYYAITAILNGTAASVAFGETEVRVDSSSEQIQEITQGGYPSGRDRRITVSPLPRPLRSSFDSGSVVPACVSFERRSPLKSRSPPASGPDPPPLLDYNILFRWFLDMNLQDASVDASTFRCSAAARSSGEK